MELDALCGLAEAALPDLPLPRGAFGEWLAQHEAGRELLAAPAADETTTGRVTELWLACAIGRGDEGAARVFDQRYVAPLDVTLARMKLAPAELDEVKQLVRAKLLVRAPDDRGAMRARVEEYAGRGRLAGLVQVAATREALTLLRGARRHAPPDDDELRDPVLGEADPALEGLKAKYRVAFRQAFAQAVAGLTAKQRNLLRLHFLGGVTLEQLAAMEGVHRATIVRWLREAREAALEATRAALGRTLGVRPDELASLHALAASRLDASLERVLRTGDEGEH